MIKKSLRNILMAGSLTALTACGGGGGGAGGAVGDFVEQDLSNLNGATQIVSEWSNLLSSFNGSYSDVNSASLMSVLTNPDQEDITLANTLLNQLDQAETLWAQTETLLAGKTIQKNLTYTMAMGIKKHMRPCYI